MGSLEGISGDPRSLSVIFMTLGSVLGVLLCLLYQKISKEVTRQNLKKKIERTHQKYLELEEQFNFAVINADKQISCVNANVLKVYESGKAAQEQIQEIKKTINTMYGRDGILNEIDNLRRDLNKLN